MKANPNQNQSSTASLRPETAVARIAAFRHRGLLLVALALLAFVPYWPTLFNGILGWDDPYYLTENYRVQQLSWATVQDMFRLTPQLGPMPNGQYTPLVELSFAVEHYFFGLDPLVYHATNLALHVLNTLLVFWFVLRLWQSRAKTDVPALPLAFLVGAFFAVHPLHVESVAWITERKDMLSGFFFLLSTSLYLRFAEKRSVWAYGGSLVAMALGLLSKQMVVALPLVLVVCDYFRAGRLSVRTLLEKVPFFALAATGAGVAFYTHLADRIVTTAEVLNWGENLLVASRGVIHYLHTFLWPISLSAFYSLAPWPEILNAEFVLSAVAVCVLLALSFAYRRRWPVVFFGWMFFLAALLPSSRLVPVGVRYLAADRFFYIPGIGFLVVTAWLVLRVWAVRTAWCPVLALGVLTLIGTWSALTWERTKVWESDTTLWDDTAPKAKDSTVILVAMAQQDLSNSALSNAVAKAFAVLEKKPQDATALNILSEVAYQDGDLEKCISFAQFADDYAGNLVLMNRPRWADALCLLGRDGEAEPILRSIVQVMPLATPVYSRLALIQLRRGDLAAVEKCLDEGLDTESKAIDRYQTLWGDPLALPRDLQDLPAWQKKMAASIQTLSEHYEFIRTAHLEVKREDLALEEYARYLSYLPACVRVWEVAAERRPGDRNINATVNQLNRKLAVTYYNHACLLNRKNQPDQALEELQLALERDASLIHDAMRDRDLTSLHDQIQRLNLLMAPENDLHADEGQPSSALVLQPPRGES